MQDGSQQSERDSRRPQVDDRRVDGRGNQEHSKSGFIHEPVLAQPWSQNCYLLPLMCIIAALLPTGEEFHSPLYLQFSHQTVTSVIIPPNPTLNLPLMSLIA